MPEDGIPNVRRAEKGGAVGGDTVSAAELLGMIRGGNAPLLMDVREPEELQSPLGVLPGVKNIPLGSLEQRWQEIPRDRDVILVCRRGNRSAVALAYLKKLGYTRVRHLEGGMEAVRAAEK